MPTIYYTFGTKAALLDESLGAAIVGFDRWREPPSRARRHHRAAAVARLVGGVQAAPTSAAALDIFFTHGVGVLQRVGPLIAAMHGATGDPEAAEVVRIAEERRVDSYREAVRVIAEQARWAASRASR